MAGIFVPRLWVVAALIGTMGIARAAEPNETSLLQPQGLSRAGLYALRQIDPTLTGQGVRFGVVCRSVTYQGDIPQNDYRPNIAHACFSGADLALHDDGDPEAAVSAHATAVCSILFGEDPAAATPYLGPFFYQGAVPAAEARVYELVHFGEQYVLTQSALPLDVVAMSFGFQFENWWTQGIESLAEHEGLLVVAGIGNGENASDPPLYPGAGTNTIGVGVVSSVRTADPATNLAYFSLAYPDQSSLGPTDDGRCKPDLIAPGNCLVAEPGDDHAYLVSGDWSSYATPVTAGVVGLLVQAARQDENLSLVLSPDGGNCALKAILMNSATKLPYWHKGRLSVDDDREAPLDLVQGAGMVNAVEAYRLLKRGPIQAGDVSTAGWDLNELDGGAAQRAYRIVLDEPAGKMLTATLVWNRHYSREFPFERIAGSDTDLRIEVWAIDPTGETGDLLLDYCDSKTDSVEHIYIQTLAGYSVYDVVVSYSDAEAAATSRLSERYGLAWSVGVRQETDSIFWHDLNADGIVDEQDISIFLDNRSLGLTAPEAYLLGDINTDGSIDASDLEVLFANRNRKADWHTDRVTN
ncbi:MAG: S8 family serine peptidase [Sedimentisphaerales bacterium]|nr:S8 family serine peptidase [Sedimentisphaerales bacterium]